jgi:long-chain acyl-CoA synthetase
VDGLLRASAEAYPDRLAVCSSSGDLTFATWDSLATTCGGELSRMLGETNAVVALGSVLATSFAIAYFGIVRSGNIVVPLNPFLGEAELQHVLHTSGARVVFVTSGLYKRIQPIRSQLPQLEYLVFLEDSPPPPDAASLEAWLGRGAGAAVPPPSDTGDDPCSEVASLLFTSGTTGLPKTVMLTHRNLTTNAVQVAEAHHLNEASVALNHLPTFHPMHLLSATYAASTQVLSASGDVVDSIDLANRRRATHYYSLPVRLASLATDARLADLTLDTVGVIASGGSALSPTAAGILTEHFGVPVIQGYGLAETSPLTHSDTPPHPRAGSVGRAVRDTECRIVDVASRCVLGTNEHGEVQVRGPQLMKGYLGDVSGSGIDAEGWFSTGDVGYIEPDGYLFLVDRIKDVFKCENWLVSPAQVESVLSTHPGVKECVVVDYPDSTKGAVSYAFIVPKNVENGRDETKAIAEYVNKLLPYYQRLAYVESVAVIPRSANGKVQRKDLRAAAFRAGSNGAALRLQREVTLRSSDVSGGDIAPQYHREDRHSSPPDTAAGSERE